MSFDWEDFTTLAGELLETADSSEVPDAAIRAAVGRTYYALFGLATDMLKARKEEIPRQSAHATVRRLLGESANPIERNIGVTLVELFRYRVMADYELAPSVPLTLELAKHCQLVGRSAVAALQAMTDEASGEPDQPPGRP